MVLTATTGLAGLLSNVGTFVTSAIGWMGQVIASITADGNEILLVTFLMAIAGFAVGLFKRLTRF